VPGASSAGGDPGNLGRYPHLPYQFWAPSARFGNQE